MMGRNFIGNSAALSAAALFGASVVATRVAVGTIPPFESCRSPIRSGRINFTHFPAHPQTRSAAH